MSKMELDEPIKLLKGDNIPSFANLLFGWKKVGYVNELG
jgi:hypothetical protein